MDFYRRAGFCISCRLNILDQQTSVGSGQNSVKLYKFHRFSLEILDKTWFISPECPIFTKYILPQENVNVNIFLSKSATGPAEKSSSAEPVCCLICYSCMQRENSPMIHAGLCPGKPCLQRCSRRSERTLPCAICISFPSRNRRKGNILWKIWIDFPNYMVYDTVARNGTHICILPEDTSGVPLKYVILLWKRLMHYGKAWSD